MNEVRIQFYYFPFYRSRGVSCFCRLLIFVSVFISDKFGIKFKITVIKIMRIAFHVSRAMSSYEFDFRRTVFLGVSQRCYVVAECVELVALRIIVGDDVDFIFGSGNRKLNNMKDGGKVSYLLIAYPTPIVFVSFQITCAKCLISLLG